MRKEDKLERRRGISAPLRCAGKQPFGRSRKKDGVVEWQKQRVNLQDARTRLAPFYMLCPLAAFVTDSAYFSAGIQLSKFPYP